MRNLNFEVYGKKEPTKENFGGHENFFLKSGFIKQGDSILDIGGASGAFLEMINKEICPIKGTVIDLDLDCLEYGNKQYPHMDFIHGAFPTSRFLKDRKFDHVTMLALFPHLKNWKAAVRGMVDLAKKYICFAAIVREYGATIEDDEVSFLYYLNTGKRVSQNILNLHEFLNFLCLQEIRAKRIIFYGAHMFDFQEHWDKDMLVVKKECEEVGEKPRQSLQEVNRKSHVFRGIPFYDEIVGSFTVELFDENDNPQRMGGLGLDGDKFEEYKFFTPDIAVYLDGMVYLIVRGAEQKIYYNVGSLLNAPTFFK